MRLNAARRRDTLSWSGSRMERTYLEALELALDSWSGILRAQAAATRAAITMRTFMIELQNESNFTNVYAHYRGIITTRISIVLKV